MEILEGEQDMLSVRKGNYESFEETFQSYLQEVTKVKYMKIHRFILCPGVSKFCSSYKKYSYFVRPWNWKSRTKREYPPYPQIYVMVHKPTIQQNTHRRSVQKLHKGAADQA